MAVTSCLHANIEQVSQIIGIKEEWA